MVKMPKTKFSEGILYPLASRRILLLTTNPFPGEKVLCFHGPLIYEAKALKWVCVCMCLFEIRNAHFLF